MLTRFKSRRLMAVLAIAGMTNAAGLLAAQAPIGAIGARTPRLISNCDVTQQSCGGDPILGPGTTSGGSKPSGGCGTGSKVFCRGDSAWTCTKWLPQTVTGGGMPMMGTTTMVCSASVTTVLKLYWP